MNNRFGISDEVFHGNVKWLLHSGIRIKEGPNKGAMYGWKDLKTGAYPFVYSEITGYSITAFSWIYSEFGDDAALGAAKDASYWIVRNMDSYGHLLPAGRTVLDTFNKKGDLTNLVYAFDNGMIVSGLLSLYKLTADPKLLGAAEAIAQAIIKRFYARSKLTAVLDRNFESVARSEDMKWSMVSGPYHSKLALGLLDLSDLTSNNLYRKISHSICDSLRSLQTPEGRFITNHEKKITYLHPHLYACEGLIYSGLKESNQEYYKRGINGIKWAIRSMVSNGGILPRSTIETDLDQSDCISQLLRLIILCRGHLLKDIEFAESILIDEVIERLHERLLKFYIPFENEKGAMRYQVNLETACSWCTMFSSQALGLWKRRKEFEKAAWIEFYI
jgi:hypothetical protein